jgi:hypothetical protein
MCHWGHQRRQFGTSDRARASRLGSREIPIELLIGRFSFHTQQTVNTRRLSRYNIAVNM